ncbi:Uncharacterised protein [Amycolatopsis camponoti]|uniref:Uncharacterized protein n=1 Tax=Amycolatopsis camponoti TaxID=2606593 RepID=A0A6I8LYI6_9PSEU|nr:hypothetical protein [Amycolatopsis camponoti]VVJ21593.1 Uncharacterised protein [Amycolatopsis camponoti]
MDAATAALLGAAIGLTGTVVAPMVTAYQAKRAKSQDLMREAYARGFACLAKIPRCDTVEDHKKLRDKMLDALAHIEIVGTKATSDLYGDVVDAYETWKIKATAPNTDFAAKAKKFEASARSDIDSTDVVGASTPTVVTRLALAVLALTLYWWARFPVAIQMSNRWLTALELGIVALASMFGVYLVVDAVIKLVKRTA